MIALRQRLLEAFEIEYQDHVEAIRKIVSRLEEAGAAIASAELTEAMRRAHSLKGAARAVGLDEVESLAHSLEALFIKAMRGETALDRDIGRHVLDSLDQIEDMVVASHAAPAAAATGPAERHDDRAGPSSDDAPNSPDTVPRERPTSVRLEASSLDRLLKSAGELRGDMLKQRLGAVDARGIAGELQSFEADWARLWKQLTPRLGRDREGGGRLLDGGEKIGGQIKSLSRHLSVTAQSLGRCARSLHHHLDDLEANVKAARMLPAESVFGGFRKMVRDIAGSDGKEVEVSIEGLDCEADRLVLQNIKDPVMHMLRNAVSHGIEPPEQRRAAGKRPQGRISLRIATALDRLSIMIEDDGRGVDFARIADKAVRLGLMSRADADAATDDALCQLLFEPGFSTADAVTKISGRGVGLSVAREAVTSLQGTLAIRSVVGQGMRIELSLPVSILSRSLLLVSFRDQVYALPSDAVVKALRVNVKDIQTAGGRPVMQFNGATLMLVSIGEALQSGDASIAAEKQNACVVVLRSGNTRFGVVVENFVGVDEFVVRNLDAGGTRRLWSGVIMTEDGSPRLVLDVEALAAHDAAGHSASIVFKAGDRQLAASKVVLVVDDSITTRTLEKSILEAHGYTVRLSVDGRDAIAQLRIDPADIVVSDVEMPHVNGFELVQAMKADKALAEIPVILVTSRDDPKDRERGLNLGADAYVVKQKFDQHDLLRTIEQIV